MNMNLNVLNYSSNKMNKINILDEFLIILLNRKLVSMAIPFPVMFTVFLYSSIIFVSTASHKNHS